MKLLFVNHSIDSIEILQNYLFYYCLGWMITETRFNYDYFLVILVKLANLAEITSNF